MDETTGCGTTIGHALAEWTAQDQAHAESGAFYALNWEEVDADFISRRAIEGLSEVYARYFIGTEQGRGIVLRAAEECGLGGKKFGKPGMAVGIIAGKIACLQAAADFDLVFRDNDDFDARVIEGLDADEVGRVVGELY